MKKEFMLRAVELSRKNMQEGAGGPFGAVIVKNGVIIGEGWNKVTSSNDPTAHAEVSAIRDACKNIENFSLEGAEIYTSCEPCPMCLGAIYWARLSTIYYGNTRKDAADIQFDDDFIYQEIPKQIQDRQIPMVQCAHNESLEVFKEWQHKADKIPY
ncbi:MAG: nucleoside deaminase [Bdellovibrio sp.]